MSEDEYQDHQIISNNQPPVLLLIRRPIQPGTLSYWMLSRLIILWKRLVSYIRHSCFTAQASRQLERKVAQFIFFFSKVQSTQIILQERNYFFTHCSVCPKCFKLFSSSLALFTSCPLLCKWCQWLAIACERAAPVSNFLVFLSNSALGLRLASQTHVTQSPADI